MFHVKNIRIFWIIEWFELEGTFKDRVVQPLCCESGYLSLGRIAQSPVQPDAEDFRDGASTASLSYLFQSLLPPL